MSYYNTYGSYVSGSQKSLTNPGGIPAGQSAPRADVVAAIRSNQSAASQPQKTLSNPGGTQPSGRTRPTNVVGATPGSTVNRKSLSNPGGSEVSWLFNSLLNNASRFGANG